MTNLILLMIGMLLVATAVSAHNEKGWEASLNVVAGPARVQLSFGQKIDATPEVDGRYDVPALPHGMLQAHFLIGPGQYWRDIHRLTEMEDGQWRLVIQADAPTSPIVLTWDHTALPSNRSIELIDVEGGVVTDMLERETYIYPGSQKREFVIRINPQGDKQ
ncbi:hypothetical protein [Desulfuromonas sp. AOP6]|uniref:hypothetical protein n=1 Tax=Desulfuromonas sp. AOP6 TaxID=1566351 RepID=UPI0012716AAD|nr:hypothetical protein [Desulfuromonas sp. AOP6]BCA79887.1 hypothetical protein AOP6_1674 [Desulfuromonas sp. AOP6]